MGKAEGETDWGCVFPALLLAAGGYWLVYGQEPEEAPPIQLSPSSSFEAPPTLNVAVPKPAVTASPPPPPAPPRPNYDFEEDRIYGYFAAISEEDGKRGKAAADAVLFRYRGNADGIARLEHVDPAGNVLSTSECAKPCVAIKTWRRGGLERLAYTTDSIIGAAFEDAIKGRLKEFRPAPPPEPDLPPPEMTQQQLREEAYNREAVPKGGTP